MTTSPSAAGSSGGLLAALALGNFVVGAGAFVAIGVLAPIGRDLGLSAVGQSWVMTAYAAVYVVASPVLTALFGPVERRRLLLAALAVFVVGCALTASASGPGLLYAGRALAAVGAGLFTPATAAVAVATAAPEARGKALAAVFAGITIAQVAGVPAGTFLGYAFGWRSAFTAAALLGVVVLAVLAVVLPRGIKVQPASLASLGRVLTTPALALAVLVTATFLGGIYVVYTFLSPLMETKLGLGRDGVTAMLAIYGLGAVAGNVLGGALSDRIGADRTILVLLVCQIALMPLVTLASYGVVVGALLLFAWSASGWSFMVPQQSRLVEIAPAETQVMLALNAASIYLAASLGAAAGGAVVEASGIPATGVVGAAVLVAVIGHLALSNRLVGRPPFGRRPAPRA